MYLSVWLWLHSVNCFCACTLCYIRLLASWHICVLGTFAIKHNHIPDLDLQEVTVIAFHRTLVHIFEISTCLVISFQILHEQTWGLRLQRQKKCLQADKLPFLSGQMEMQPLSLTNVWLYMLISSKKHNLGKAEFGSSSLYFCFWLP